MSELLTLGRVRLATDGGADSTPPGAQPKRVALLAYLALETAAGPVRRDALLALFWPELGEDEARRALRQGLHHLRRVVGENVIVAAGDELTLNDGTFQCDAVTFERLVARGQFTEALALYRGDFFDGFHVDDVAPELEEWVSRTRARIKRRASAAAWSAADAAASANEAERAIELGRRGCELDPDQEAGWRRLMALQDRLGDRAGALRTYEELSGRLEREFDAKPAAETTELAERIRTIQRSPVPVPVAPAGLPPVEPGPSTPAPLPEPSQPRRSWRPALIGGLVGVVAVVGVVGAYIRLSESESGPSLVAAGALAAKDRVVVADFNNLVDDSLLAAGITEAFRVDLSQSPLVRVLSSRQVAGVLARMEQPPSSTLNEELAREVAVREGAKAIVTGSVANLGGAFTVSVELVGTAEGEVLAALRETAADSSELIAAVDRASKQLRHRIGESLRSLRSLPRLEDETTASLAALRKYTEGQRLVLAGRRPEAIRLFQEAIDADTAFASAHVALGMAYASIAELGRASAALHRAVVHQQRLPFLERHFTVASHAYGRGDYETAIAAYTRVLERYPDDIRALNNLALIYRDRHQFASAESLFTRAAEVDSTIANLYFGIHSTQLLQAKFRESRSTLDLIGRRFPGNPILLNVEIQDAAAQQRWEEAERQAETTIAAARGDTLLLIDPYEALAGITMTQGRLSDAERLWRTHLTLSAATDSWGRHLFGLLQFAKLQLRYRDAPARALALVDSALAAIPLDSVLPGDRPYDDLARFYALAGRLTRARELLDAAAANDSTLARTAGPDRTWTRGVIALAEGRVADAESELRQAAEGLVCPICVLPDLARVYEAARKPDAALVVYERYLATPWLWRYEPDAVDLGWVMKRLAELYDARGEPAKAAAMRRRLLQLWRRADPALQPIVAEVRGRLPS
ncbi:MAG TPA: BTAD domain-containing putative transcriptional regulator [Gemmatimonadaceae bacterium]|nr:BTAD domain-containing putative transcriptional regulator [Gemmatimonadaceae bacterium]